MSRRTGFTTDVAVTFLSRGGMLFINVLSGIVVARTLGPANKGLYVLTFLPLNQAIIFACFGFAHALVFFMGSGRISKAEAFGHYLFVSVAFFAVSAGPYLWAVAEFADDFLKGVDLTWLKWSTLLLFPSLLTYFGGGALRGINRVDLYNLINIFDVAVRFVCIVIFLLVLSGGLRGAVAAMFMGIVLSGVFSLGVVAWSLGSWPRLNFGRLREMAVFGLKSYLSIVFQLTERKIDMFMLGYFLAEPVMATQVGFYSLAVSLSEMPRNFSTAVSAALLPKISSSTAAENLENVPRVSRNVLFINLAFSLGLALLGYPLIWTFYGRAFLPAFFPFLLLLPGVAAAGLVNVFQSELVGTGSPLKMSIFSGVTLALHILLMLFLIPPFGIMGAAATSGITYSLMSVLLLLDYRRRRSNVKIKNLLVPAREDLVYYRRFLESLKSRWPRFSRPKSAGGGNTRPSAPS